MILITNACAAPPNNFKQSKHAAGQIFSQHPYTIYCGCTYRGKSIDLHSCGMDSASSIKRAHQLEWEHMMPAENFGRQLACWRENICVKNGRYYKGRKCCERTSEEFRRMEAELYNIWPIVGLVNQARSNYRFNDFGGIIGNFYGCPILIDKQLRMVEPKSDVKGIVARANLFMAQKYGIKISASQNALFNAWNRKYPPSEWEKRWAVEITKIEGYSNGYISKY